MTPSVENALAAAGGALVVSFLFRSAAKVAVRRQIMAGIAQLDEQLDRDRDASIEALPTQARAAIDAEVTDALREYGLTPAIVQSLIRAVAEAARVAPSIRRALPA